jgi:hypothetical protein
MDEKPDEIIEEIETQRSRLGANLNELETRVRRTTDWRTHFDNNPMLMLGAALGGGLILGAIVGGGSRSSRSRSSYTSSRHFSSSPDVSSSNSATAMQRHKASETIDHIKGAMIAFATAKAKEFLNQAIPGFDGYLRDTEAKQPRSPGSEPFSASEYGQQGYGSAQTGNYGQQTSGSGQGANYGQDYGSSYTRPSGQENTVTRP